MCKQFKARWWRAEGSCSISPEKGKVVERFKEVLKKRWRKLRDDHRLMDKPTEKEIDTIPDASFTSFICFS